MSIAMYGAPIWHDALGESNQMVLGRPQCVLAGLVIRSYRTVSTEVAYAMVGSLQWDPEANVLVKLYR